MDGDDEAVAKFHKFLKSSTKIMALLGAGLSAYSGLSTFRGAGGFWRSFDAVSLASPQAFQRDPALVWRFYCYRRHKALQAQPNEARYALARLAHHVPGFLALSQNVDGLVLPSRCGYQAENYQDPIVPALAVDGKDLPSVLGVDRRSDSQGVDIADAAVPLPDIPRADLPHCPQCTKALLRPNVVWFGEQLPGAVLSSVDQFLRDNSKIDLMFVIGASAKVYPAAVYIQDARHRGARLCVVNIERDDEPSGGWDEGDFFFQGDAATILPRLLEPVIGRLEGTHAARIGRLDGSSR